MKKTIILGLSLMSFAANAHTEVDQFSVSVKGGIAPTTYTNKGSVFHGFNGAPIVRTAVPNFTKTYNLPITIGGELSYGVLEDTEVFVEGNYQSAGGKRVAFAVFPTQTSKFETYRNVNVYGGVRYFHELFPGASVFIGGKLGIEHRKENAFKVLFGGTQTKFVLYKTHTAFSGGLHVGAERTIFRNLSIGVQAEGVLSDKLNTSNTINSTVSGIPTHFRVTKTGAKVSFPVTGFVKMRF